jgi:hypothetical protein
MLNKFKLWLTKIGITEKTTSKETKNIIIKIITIQKKSFIFHLLNLFRKGEKSMLKKSEKNSIKTMLAILYKNKIQAKNHKIINILKKNFLYSLSFRNMSFIKII